jgi:hypothetical protein
MSLLEITCPQPEVYARVGVKIEHSSKGFRTSSRGRPTPQ